MGCQTMCAPCSGLFSILVGLLFTPLLSAASEPEPAPTSFLSGANIHAMRMEKVIEIARRMHPNMRIISIFQEQEDGLKLDKIIYTLPTKEDPQIITINPQTAKVIKDRAYRIQSQQSIVPLERLLAKLRKRYDIATVIRTRMAYRNEQDVRLIVYSTKSQQQRILTVNAVTGAVLSDEARSS